MKTATVCDFGSKPTFVQSLQSRERKGRSMEYRRLIGVGIGALVGAVLGMVIGRMAFGTELAGGIGIALGVAIGVALGGAWARR